MLIVLGGVGVLSERRSILSIIIYCILNMRSNNRKNDDFDFGLDEEIEDEQ